MKEKFINQVSKIISKVPIEEQQNLYNVAYEKLKKDIHYSAYVVEEDYFSFSKHYFDNLSQKNKKDLEILGTAQFDFISNSFDFKSIFNSFVDNNNSNDEDKAFVVKFIIFYIIAKEVIDFICPKELLMQKIKFSQSVIAKEFEVDNDTLSKWFELLYGRNIYYGRKQLTLGEYFQIFKDLFLEPNESFNIDKNIEIFRTRVLIGKTYTKKEIIEFGFDLDDEPTSNNYSEAKKKLSLKFDFYDKYDKYPYSIAIKLINYLKEIN